MSVEAIIFGLVVAALALLVWRLFWNPPPPHDDRRGGGEMW